MIVSRVPEYLWEALAKANDDDEIEIGTIRVEGSFDNPERVSLMLNNSEIFLDVEKEFILKKPPTAQKPKQPGSVLMFSEKNKPGYKQRANVWDQIDEDGNPGQGRSQLYEQALRDEKKKENKGKFIPYVRRPIPKITAIAGTVHQEFEAVPVKNEEFNRLDSTRTRMMLMKKEQDNIEIKTNVNPLSQIASVLSAAERQDINKVRPHQALILFRLTTISSKHREGNKKRRRTVLLVLTRPYWWVNFSSCSANTNTGVCAISVSG